MSYSDAINKNNSTGGGGYSAALGKDTSLTGGKGYFVAVNSKTKSSDELNSVDGLFKLAKEKGLLDQATEAADQTPKLSTLERLSAGLSAFNPAEAIMRGQDGTQNFLTAYPTTVVQGIASALTGEDYGDQTKRRYFSDLAQNMGIENHVARFGVGLVGDIFLDPSTYIGGTLIRGALGGTKLAAKTGVKVIGKFAPELETAINVSAKATKEAFGELFVNGFGSTKGLPEEMLTYLDQKSKVMKGLAKSVMDRLGTGVMNEDQSMEFVGTLLKGKNAELDFVEQTQKDLIEAFNKSYPNAKFPLEDVPGAMRRMENLAVAVPKTISKLQELRQRLAQPFIADDLLGLKDTVAQLKSEITKMTGETTEKVIKKVKGKELMATDEQANAALLSSLSTEKQKYREMIAGLMLKLDNMEKDVIAPAMKQVQKQITVDSARYNVDEIMQMVMRDFDPRLSIKDKITELDSLIRTTQNDMFAKQSILERVLESKSIAKKKIADAFASGDFSTLPEELVLAMKPAIKAAGFSTIKVATKTAGILTEETTRDIVKAQEAGLSGLAKYAKDHGGITVTLDGKIKTDGYAFSIQDKAAEVRIKNDPNFDQRFIDQFNKTKAQHGGDPKAHMGGWMDNGDFVADTSSVSNNLKESLYDAIIKRQDAIGNLARYTANQDGNIFITRSLIDSIEPLSRGSLKASKSTFRDWDEVKAYYNAKDFKNSPEIDAIYGRINSAGVPVKEMKIGAISEDKVVEDALLKQIKRNAETARKAHIEDPFRMYFPSLDKTRLKDFMYKTRTLKIGSEAWRKEYKNLIKEEDLLRDPVKAFFKVESEAAINSLNRSVMENTVEKYGLPVNAFKGEKEATAAGYKMWREKGTIMGKEIGWLKDRDWQFVNGQIGGTYGAIDALAKATGFDAATSLFKRFVTGLFAPFHVRNWVSGMIQNYEVIGSEALNPTTIALGNRIAYKMSQGAFRGFGEDRAVARSIGKHAKSFGSETIELGGKTWYLDDITQAVEKRFGGSSRYIADFNSITGDAKVLQTGEAFSKDSMASFGKKMIDHKKPLWSQMDALTSQDSPHFKAAQVIGGFIETQQKAAMVIAGLKKGMNLEDALKLAEKAGFDYRALTPFESHIMRRIIPFYSFNRKNIELQLSTLKQHPERINATIRSIDNLRSLWETELTDDEKNNLPAYLREYLSVPIGRSDKTGNPQFIRTFGTPIEAFTQLYKDSAEGKSSIERTFLGTLSQVNPYIKVPIEFGIGKDSFRQRDIKDVYNAVEYQDAPQFLKDYLRLKEVTKKSATGETYTQYVADPERLAVVRALPTSRGFTYVNNIFNGDVKGFFKIMDALSGIKTTEVDPEYQAGLTERQRQDALGALLRRYGIVSEFNKLFIPSDKNK